VKGFLSKCIALKVDVIGAETILSAGACPSVFQTGTFTGCGSGGLNGEFWDEYFYFYMFLAR